MPANNVSVEPWKLRVPLDPPIQAPKGPATEIRLLLVFATGDQGHRGAGYASFRKAAEMGQAKAPPKNSPMKWRLV